MRMRKCRKRKAEGRAVWWMARKLRVCVNEWGIMCARLERLRMCQYIFTTRLAFSELLRTLRRPSTVQHLFSELPTATADDATCYNIKILYCMSCIYVIYIKTYIYCICMRMWCDVCTQRGRLRFSQRSAATPPPLTLPYNIISHLPLPTTTLAPVNQRRWFFSFSQYSSSTDCSEMCGKKLYFFFFLKTSHDFTRMCLLWWVLNKQVHLST